MAVFIPDIFSGYMQGMRQANEDNWKDLSNYNSTLQGQLGNAFKMATFDPAVRTAWNQGQMSDNATTLNNLGTDAARRQTAVFMQNYGPEMQGMYNLQALQNNLGLQGDQYNVSKMNAALAQMYTPKNMELQYQQGLKALEQLQNGVNGVNGVNGARDLSMTIGSNQQNQGNSTGTTDNTTVAQQGRQTVPTGYSTANIGGQNVIASNEQVTWNPSTGTATTTNRDPQTNAQRVAAANTSNIYTGL